MKNVDKAISQLNNLCSRIYPNYNFVLRFNDLVDALKDDYHRLPTSPELYKYGSYDTCTEADIYQSVWDEQNNRRKQSTGKSRSYYNAGLDCMLLKWIQNKVVYSFDIDVEESFSHVTWDDLKDISVTLLENLPLDCFAISFNRPIITSDSKYDFCLVMNDVRYKLLSDNSLERMRSSGLIFVLMCSDNLNMTYVIAQNIEPTEGFDMNFDSLYNANAQENYKGDASGSYRSMLTFLLPYVFYVCSQNAEISQDERNKEIYRPFKLEPKHKYREVKQMVCGELSGARIRDFKKRQSSVNRGGLGSVKSPHVRRAHYHRYWVGSGDDKHVEIRWIPPVYIHEELKNFIKPVKAKVKKEYR